MHIQSDEAELSLDSWTLSSPSVVDVSAAELFEWLEADICIKLGCKPVLRELSYPIFPLLSGVARFDNERLEVVDLVYGGDSRTFLIRLIRDREIIQAVVADGAAFRVAHDCLLKSHNAILSHARLFMCRAGVNEAVVDELIAEVSINN